MNDGLDMKLVAEVQALRYELEHLANRDQARALKPKLVALHEASRGAAVSADAGHIIDQFFEGARDRIVKLYGTAAWEDPETLQEVLARMAAHPLPQAPAQADRIEGILRFIERGIAPPFGEIQEVAAEVRRLRALEENGDLLALIGEEAVRRLRHLTSDEWLRAAAEEIADKYESGTSSRLASAVTILRKHRDGKA